MPLKNTPRTVLPRVHSGTSPATPADVDHYPDAAMVDVKTVAILTGRSIGSCWRDAREGRLPRPIKTGPACTRWNLGAIRRHLAALGVPA